MMVEDDKQYTMPNLRTTRLTEQPTLSLILTHIYAFLRINTLLQSHVNRVNYGFFGSIILYAGSIDVHFSSFIVHFIWPPFLY
jgi:hypothetical protein